MPSKKVVKIKLKLRYKILIALLVITSSFILWARYISTAGFIVNEHKITSNNIPASFHGLKIVHITDIHYGRIITKDRLSKIVNEINIINPDIVVFTGDLIDKDIDLTDKMKDNIINQLGKITARYGKYAVSGNHDFVFPPYKEILKESDFTCLDNDYDLVYNEQNDFIYLAGLESEIKGDPDIDKATSFLTNEDTKEQNNNLYKILIMHTPDTFSKVKEYNFELVLAGHSHNGQIRLPGVGAIVTPPGAKKYYKPYYKIGKTELYISSGLGTSEINLRFFNKPAFNLYRITKKGD